MIAAGAAVLDALGVREQTKLELNTLGDTPSREAYRAVLVDYLGRFKDDLSEDSRNRLDKNPLRILDSKNPRDREIVADAPVFGDSLTDEAKDWFDAVRAGLDAIGIAYELNDRLVRRAGLLLSLGIRIHDRSPWGPGRRHRRRPLRRPDRPDGRPGHARRRLGRRY